ncbi:MAG TPA: hypothetical protein VF323_01780 [Candidatus Limnocylindrales bacterium]
MDSRSPSRVEVATAGSPAGPSATPSAEAAAFIRFCYRRRRTGWPELYDEMCAVAGRRLYNGWGFQELADIGIGFSLFETPTLAALARAIALEEAERRSRGTTVPATTGPSDAATDVGDDGGETALSPLQLAGVNAT